MPVFLLTQLFIANLVSGRQLTQLFCVKLTKVQRYLFIAALTISVQPSIFRYQAEFSYKVVLKYLLSCCQKSLTNYMPQLEIIMLSILQSLYILLTKPSTSSSINSPVTKIKYYILVRQSIITKIYLYVLLQHWHTNSIVI